MNIWGCTELDINIGPYCMDIPQETKNSPTIQSSNSTSECEHVS